MNRPLASLARLLLPFTSATALLGACGGTTGPSGSTGASDQSFCSAFKDYYATCPSTGSVAACDQALVAEIADDCSPIAATFSEAFKTGLTTCAPSTCVSNDPFATPCLIAATQTFSAAQQKLASDYCAACPPPAGQECLTWFWGFAGDGGVSAEPGPGGGALLNSDTIVQSIDSTCVPPLGNGGAAACENFSTCEQNQVTAGTSAIATPAACKAATSPADGG